MAWSTPRTWTDNEVIDASIMNAHVRDQLRAIGLARTTYGSGASWTAATTNPSLGNGTWTGHYLQAGKLIIGTIRILAGSTTTFGSGGFRFALPVTAFAADQYPVGSAFLIDNSGGTQVGVAVLNDADNLRVNYGSAGQAGAAAPWAWANGDEILISFEYEAA